MWPFQVGNTKNLSNREELLFHATVTPTGYLSDEHRAAKLHGLPEASWKAGRQFGPLSFGPHQLISHHYILDTREAYCAVVKLFRRLVRTWVKIKSNCGKIDEGEAQPTNYGSDEHIAVGDSHLS